MQFLTAKKGLSMTDIECLHFSSAQGPCRQLRWCLRHKYHTTKGVKEHKMIRCDKFGYFKPLQKLDGRKICVDPQGNIRKSSGVKGNQDCLCKHVNRHFCF